MGLTVVECPLYNMSAIDGVDCSRGSVHYYNMSAIDGVDCSRREVSII